VKGKRVQNIFISPPHEDKYLLDGEDQFLVQVSQKLYLGVTLWKHLRDYHMNELIECWYHHSSEDHEWKRILEKYVLFGLL